MKFNIYSHAFMEDPYPLIREARATHGVAVSEKDRVFALSHALCREILTDGKTFRSKPPARSTTVDSWLIFKNGEAHMELRALFRHLFAPSHVEGLRQTVREAVDSAVEEALELGEFDFVQLFSRTIPVSIISALLGVPPSLNDALFDLTANAAIGVEPMSTAAMREVGFTALRSMMEILKEVGIHLQAAGTDRVWNAAPSLAEDGPLARQFLENVVFIYGAGHHTTGGLLSGSAALLAERPALLEELRADEGLVPSAVEELCRFVSPVPVISREVTRTTEIDGIRFEEGHAAFVMLAAANRDPAAFVEPDSIDLRRSPNRHLVFAAGPHFCLGPQLAKIELQETLAALATRVDKLELTGPPSFHPLLATRVHRALPMRAIARRTP